MKLEKKGLRKNPSICIVLSYFSVGTRIVWRCIIAFMANKRKDAPVMSGTMVILCNNCPLDSSTIPSRNYRSLRDPNPPPLPLDHDTACYCHRVVRSVVEGVAIGFVFAQNIVRGLPDPVNRPTTLWDTRKPRNNTWKIVRISEKRRNTSSRITAIFIYR